MLPGERLEKICKVEKTMRIYHLTFSQVYFTIKPSRPEALTRTSHNLLSGPLFMGFVFLGSVAAASSLTKTFSLAPPIRKLVLFAPLPFLLLFVLVQWRFFRSVKPAERAEFFEALWFATIIGVSVLALGEVFAFLGARVWNPAEVWHWVVLLACLLGARRARSRHP